MQIMIVDDFQADRNILHKMIQENKSLDLKICAECADGFEAVLKARELNPDICLCDINMPKMNGFQFAKALRLEGIKTKIIFCSMYSEFEYAKEAMYLDSYGYVLKPVDTKELNECIQKAAASIYVQQKTDEELQQLKRVLEENRPLIEENFIRDLMTGLIGERENLLEKTGFFYPGLVKGPYAAVLVEIDDFTLISDGLTVGEKQLIGIRVYHKIRSAVQTKYAYAITRIDEQHIGLLFSLQGEQKLEHAEAELKNLCRTIVGLFWETDISITCSISAIDEDISRVDALMEQGHYIMRYKFLLGKACVLTQQDITNGADVITTDFNVLFRDIQYLMNTGVHAEIVNFIERTLSAGNQDNIADTVRNLSSFIVTSVQMTLNEQNIRLREIYDNADGIWSMLNGFETIFDLKKWLIDFLWEVRSHLKDRTESQENVLVRRVKEYVNGSLTKEIKLETIAKELFYTPNYLNSMFKRMTQETISEYIIRKRIEYAKTLLKNPQLKLNEISAMVQYSHPAYFNSVFKKYTGITPREYREQMAAETGGKGGADAGKN